VLKEFWTIVKKLNYYFF